MYKNIIIILSVLLFLWGCASVKVREDYFFIPIHVAESGVGATANAAFNESTLTFTNIENLSTITFYQGKEDTRVKKSAGNSITLITAKREEIKKFYP
ncbi:hypothetical protein LCGC14_1708300, partial [marine sediment metagenome]